MGVISGFGCILFWKNGWQVLKHKLRSLSQRSLNDVNIRGKHKWKLRHKYLDFLLSSVHSEYLFNVIDIKRVFHFGFLSSLPLTHPSEATVTGTYNIVMIRNWRKIKLSFSNSMLQRVFLKPDLIVLFDPVACEHLNKCNTLTHHTSSA